METGRDLIMIASQEYSRMPGTSRFATEEDLGRLPQSRPLVIWSRFSFELFVLAGDSPSNLGGISAAKALLELSRDSSCRACRAKRHGRDEVPMEGRIRVRGNQRFRRSRALVE
jgi:hypothetical protein